MHFKPSALALSALLLLSRSLLPAGSPLALSFTLPVVRKAVTGQLRGVTGDGCHENADCEGERQCLEESAPFKEVPCTKGLSCRCFPSMWQECTQSADCETREVCTRVLESTEVPADFPNPFCASAIITGVSPAMIEVKGNLERDGKSPSHGLTLFPCERDANICRGDRSCMFHDDLDEEMMPCEPGKECFCFPNEVSLCTENTICQQGELCAHVPGGFQICVAADAEAALPEVTALGDEDKRPKNVHDGGGPGRHAKGITGDECRRDSDCLEDRICVLSDMPLNLEDCFEGQSCVCIRSYGAEYCQSNDDCIERETCSHMQDLNEPACVSTVLVGYSDDDYFLPVEGDGGLGRSGAAGFTLYPCRKDDQCEGDRKCMMNGKKEPIACDDGDANGGCFCFPKVAKVCVGSQECESREVCTRLPEVQMCVSEDVEAAFLDLKAVGVLEEDEVAKTEPSSAAQPMREPERSPEADTGDSVVSTPESSEAIGESGATQRPDDGGDNSSTVEDEEAESSVEPETTLAPSMTSTASPSPSRNGTNENTSSDSCIDVKALSHMSRSDLAFEKDSLSRVLCDWNESCATKGHMVVFGGKGMTMGRYCQLVGGCAERVMFVNSPKYRRGLRVESRTKGLRYSAFAARYETWVEEVFMGVALRVGL